MNELKQYLEELIDERQLSVIRFLGDNDAIANIQTRILEIDNRDGMDYLMTEDGLEIRVDRLQEVNGRSFKGLC